MEGQIFTIHCRMGVSLCLAIILQISDLSTIGRGQVSTFDIKKIPQYCICTMARDLLLFFLLQVNLTILRDGYWTSTEVLFCSIRSFSAKTAGQEEIDRI